MASGGRLPPRRGRRMLVVGEGRQKERGRAGNRPHARGKRKRRGKSTARAPLRVGNRPRESFTASAGEGRGREKAADGPRPPLGCYSARVHRPAAPAAEPACISAWPSALPPRALLCICRPLCLAVRSATSCSALSSALHLRLAQVV